MATLQSIIEKVAQEMLEKLCVTVTNITVTETEENIYNVNIESPEANYLIGFHGETIQALQTMMKILVWKNKKDDLPFTLKIDVDGYRKRQEENVIMMAEKKAELARRTMEDQFLPPMSPYFRRLVHMHFAEKDIYTDIETESVGEGDHRQVKVHAKLS